MVYLLLIGAAFLWTVMPRHLEALGWSSAAVGALYGGRKVVESLSMGWWSSLTDEIEATLKLVRVQLGLGAAAVLAMPWLEDARLLTLCVMAHGLALGGALPLLDSLTFHEVGSRGFGKMRAWGSVGYGGAALMAALWGQQRGYAGLAQAAPWAIAALTLGAALMTWVVRLSPTSAWALGQDERASATAQPVSAKPPRATGRLQALGLMLRRPRVVGLLGLCAAHWVLMAPYNMFFVALCERKGLPAYAPGLGVALGIMAEIVALRRAGGWMERIDARALFALALSVTALRWAVTGWGQHVGLVVAAQALHGLGFGLFFATAIALLQRELEPAQRARGQAAFYVVVFSLGSLLGESIAGVARDVVQAEGLFQGATLAQAALIAPALWYARASRHEAQAPGGPA